MSEITHKPKKELYYYQQEALNRIFKAFEDSPEDYHLLYQLPTGGGKTVVFSEITRQYLKHHQKKVLIMTHRIELCKQTHKMLNEFDVENKIINSKADLSDQNEYNCFVAMVETLNNRLNDGQLDISDVGLVIIDEAHYNSFTKLFKFFEKSFLLGVTATPLSSNIKTPMRDNYDDLFVGESIGSLIGEGFLAKANVFSYNVGLTSLEVGANGDYTTKSSEDLYTNHNMLSKLIQAYEERAKGTKTLIFNNGINTSLHVYDMFKQAGYSIAHLDNTNTRTERDDILKWFHETPNAIITSVSILTTGFDEPSVKSIILNRATKSLTLYYQMIGRGSRIFTNKSEFNVIDLGNNLHRFGSWGADLDWHKMFRAPNFYLDNLLSDEEIESDFRYELPKAIRGEFEKTTNEELYFNVKKVYIKAIAAGESSKVVLQHAIEHHTRICAQNSEDMYDALVLAKYLGGDIEDVILRYSKCICTSTKNFIDWLQDDYKKKLNSYIRTNFDAVFEEIHGHPPIEE